MRGVEVVHASRKRIQDYRWAEGTEGHEGRVERSQKACRH